MRFGSKLQSMNLKGGLSFLVAIVLVFVSSQGVNDQTLIAVATLATVFFGIALFCAWQKDSLSENKLLGFELGMIFVAVSILYTPVYVPTNQTADSAPIRRLEDKSSDFSILTAGKLGDLAVKAQSVGENATARKYYEQALAIYAMHPTYVDAQMCSTLEHYAVFLERNKDRAAAEVCAKAVHARRRLHHSNLNST